MEKYFKIIEDTFNVKIKVNYELFENNCCTDIIEKNMKIEANDDITEEKVRKLIHEYCDLYKTQLEKQAKENFINDIITLRFENIDLILNRSELLGFDFYIDRQAIIIEIEDLYKILKGKNEMLLQKYKENFYEEVIDVFKNEDDIVSYIGNNRFLICKTREKNIEEKMKILLKRLKEKWELQYKISIGDLYDMPGIEAMSYSYKDAENYMKIGKKFLKKEEIYTFDKIGIYTLFFHLGKFEKQKIVKYIEKALEYGEKNRIDISEIIHKFYENKFIVNKTALDLGLSTSKLKEIFTDINNITNLDVYNFEDAIKFYIAFKINDGEKR